MKSKILGKPEVEELQKELYAPEVDDFLKQADEAAKTGALDWDIVSKVAYVSYYRTYFEKDHQDAEVKRAIDWLVRALNMNPNHVELTMKYAEMLGNQKDYDAAAAILERLERRPEAPTLVSEWFGLLSAIQS